MPMPHPYFESLFTLISLFLVVAAVVVADKPVVHNTRSTKHRLRICAQGIARLTT